MQFASILSEAKRNLKSGTSRQLLFTFLFAIIISVLTLADLLSVTGILQSAQDYRSSGASIITLETRESVDGDICDGLSKVEGINNSGAMRNQKLQFTPYALPSGSIPIIYATDGFANLLGDLRENADSGVYISQHLADRLGADIGDDVTSIDGSKMHVKGVFGWYEASVSAPLGYAIIVPENSSLTVIDNSENTNQDKQYYDSCWAEIWPQDDSLKSLLWTTLHTTSSNSSNNDAPKMGQLNGSLGQTFKGSAMFNERFTGWVTLLILLIAIGLGFLTVRMRRLELSSALHARVSRSAQRLQLQIETVAWSATACVIALPILLFSSIYTLADDKWALYFIIIKALLLSVIGAALGALLGTALTKENQLFNYFKER